ncbi:MAG TPA: RNA methyltransferase [Treponema sp.]|nr:RNA methyltransferase [Treponema sp.]
MNLGNIVIVLSRPEESRNVGAVCRGMANSGIHTLRIVGRREDFDDTRVRILAVHAADIWDKAQFFPSITAAAADCTCVAGTTRRRGKKRKSKLLMPEEFASLAANITGNGEEGGKIAAVFGNERTGLTDEELLECTTGVTIPSSEEFASLNLSHAVQVICYHLFRQTQAGFAGYKPVTLERLEQTVGTIAGSLQRMGFSGTQDIGQFWRSVLARAALSEGEARYIEAEFSKAAGLFARKNGGSPPS